MADESLAEVTFKANAPDTSCGEIDWSISYLQLGQGHIELQNSNTCSIQSSITHYRMTKASPVFLHLSHLGLSFETITSRAPTNRLLPGGFESIATVMHQLRLASLHGDVTDANPMRINRKLM